MDIELLVGSYIKLRDLKEAREKAHKDKQRPIVDAMAKIEQQLHTHMLDTGIDSCKVGDVGTAFFVNLDSATVKDWTSALEFITTNEEWDFLEARVSKAAVRDYIEKNNEPPPGVEFKTIKQVRVRR